MHQPPDQTSTAPLALLELIVSDQPALLAYTVSVLRASHAKPTLLRLAGEWGIDLSELSNALSEARKSLDFLERGARSWQHPQEVLPTGSEESPACNVAALWRLTLVRSHRMSGIRCKRLTHIARKLQRILEVEQTKSWITNFLAETETRDLSGSSGPPPGRTGAQHV